MVDGALRAFQSIDGQRKKTHGLQCAALEVYGERGTDVAVLYYPLRGIRAS